MGIKSRQRILLKDSARIRHLPAETFTGHRPPLKPLHLGAGSLSVHTDLLCLHYSNFFKICNPKSLAFLSGYFKNLDLTASQTAQRRPSSSRPTNTSQEPGVKGVIKASKPKIIKITPTIFLTGESLSVIFLYQARKSAIILILTVPLPPARTPARTGGDRYGFLKIRPACQGVPKAGRTYLSNPSQPAVRQAKIRNSSRKNNKGLMLTVPANK